MCLSGVKKVYKVPLGKVRIGYKVMKNQNHGYFNSEYYPFPKNKKIGTTVICKQKLTKHDNVGIKYPLGFHIYRSIPRSFYIPPDYIIVVVCYTNIVCGGKQNGLNVDVAKQMTFIKFM